MTTTSSGAVGFAPVGTFVKDLASELGKAPATLVAYLKKHLPATLTKRKNANKRLANFVTEDGVAGLRAHYTPTTESSELQRLREENARLRALLTDDPTESIESLEQKRKALDVEIELALEGSEQRREETKECLARAEITIERLEYEEITNDKPKLFTKEYFESRREQTKAIRQLLDEQDEEYERECQSRVVRFPTEKVRKTDRT